MSPLMQKVIDAAMAVVLTAGVVFVIVVSNAFLMSRGGSMQGIKTWFAFIGRPDIIGIMILTAMVSMAYVFWQQGGRR